MSRKQDAARALNEHYVSPDGSKGDQVLEDTLLPDPKKMGAMEVRLSCRFEEAGVFAEMAQPLEGYREKTLPIAGVSYGWYCGSLETLRACVRAVEPEWVQYFTGESPVFCAFLGEEPVSFCQVEETQDSILAGEKIGSIGCVGTVPWHRGRGIGLRMVDLATLELQKRGMACAYIHYTAIDHWYKKLGYQVLARFSFKEKI